MAEDTKLRDELARDRTALANERTLLSYGRTALALVGAAILIFKFTSPEMAMTFGALALTAAGFVLFWGIHSYRAVATRIGTHVSDVEKDAKLLLAEAD